MPKIVKAPTFIVEAGFGALGNLAAAINRCKDAEDLARQQLHEARQATKVLEARYAAAEKWLMDNAIDG